MQCSTVKSEIYSWQMRYMKVTYPDIKKTSGRQEGFIIRYGQHNLWPPAVLIAGKETLIVVLE